MKPELQDRIGEAIASFVAIHTFKNGKKPSDTEIEAAFERISKSVVNSDNNRAQRQAIVQSIVDDLAERRAAVLADAKHNRVKFLHDRAKQETIVSSDVLMFSKTAGIHTGKFELNQATHGGRTLAYAYEIDEDGGLLMEIAVAHCRNDEAYCEVIGMEQSLQYFLDGRTITIPVSHERLGPGKLDMISKEFNQTYHQ